MVEEFEAPLATTGRDGDEALVAQLLGREPAGAFTVVVRRLDGTPAVIENAPLLRDGRPMPTRFWLVDPELRGRIARLEAAGGVREAAANVEEADLVECHRRYAEERDVLLPPGWTGPRPSGGVGGTREGVKCLHAHVAWWLAGGDDPVGLWTAGRLGVHRDAFVMEGGGVLTNSGPVAALDCGTNSTRLLVVADNGATLERHMRITRLGKGVDATSRLAPAAITRTLEVLRDYRELMDKHGVVRARLVATSAARDAQNGMDFLEPAAKVTGVRPEVLSGDEEGRLSFLGATGRLPASLRKSQSVLVVDIGGGSTELSVGHTNGQQELIAVEVATTSLNIGCVRLSERFLLHDPPELEELAAARTEAQTQVAGARAKLPHLMSDALLIGVAGTVSTLAALEYDVTTYDRARIHHAVLERTAVDRWFGLLAAEEAGTRLTHPGMEEGRQDVIVGGALILAVVMEAFGQSHLLVSEDDILDGLVFDLLAPMQ
jgi:exopolyphosphatase / guanosine-5'-triphosphate,3'-diphosphate pyrophosphatase